MHDKNLEAILNDPASTAEEKAAAQTALLGHADPLFVQEQTRWMLTQLGKQHIEELTEADYERYCVQHCVKPSDPIVDEFRYWFAPDDDFLELIGMTLPGYWQAVYERATAARRPDAQPYALRNLQGMEAT